ncbi:SPASM domain-containing protein [bacterium]|nr:SPASM domain-containing protein [bacterium]
MHFHRVHIEVTNICGLACSFCPPKLSPSKTMPLPFFHKVVTQLRPYTKGLAFHVMGDPLTLSNLDDYLDIAHREDFEVTLTTSGYYLKKSSFETLFHPAVRQLNISLNSYNKNSLNLTFDDYMDAVLDICAEKLARHPKPFINLRLWNFDEACSEAAFNTMLFERLSAFFEIPIDLDSLYAERPKSLRLASKVLLHFDSYFEWPSLNASHDSDGSCYGLRSHIGILADGTVVPCCLDGEGVIALGNLHDTPLSDVLDSERAQKIRNGFLQGKAVEELCRKCSYKDRFTDTTH